MLRTYSFLNFLLQRYLRDKATFFLVYSNFAPDIFLFYLFIFLFIYLFIYLSISLLIYVFIYLCMNVSTYLFFIHTENLKCYRRTLGLSLLGYQRGFKWKNSVDIWGTTPQEKFTCQRKLYSQINYPYFENKTLTFFWERSRMDGKEPLQEHIYIWENLLYKIYSFLIKFLRISYTDLHLCSFLFFFQILIKYLKINVLYEWAALSRQPFCHSFTSLFIVKGERLLSFSGKIQTFLLLLPLCIPFSEIHSF